MKKRVILTLLLLLAALSCTAWAAGEKDMLEIGTAETQVLLAPDVPELSLQESGPIQEEPLYQSILEMFQKEEPSVEISQYGLSTNNDGDDKLLYYVTKVLYDHPEIYYARTAIRYSYSPSSGTIKTLLAVYIDGLRSAEAKAAMDRKVNEAMALVDDQNLTDLDKALILHDYLVEQVAYNWEVDIALKTGEAMSEVEKRTGVRIYTAYGALAEGDAVCQGYALAYKLLLNRCGVDSVLVSSEKMNHVWNLVKINGSWYHVDVTWDDPTPNLPGHCGHDSFLRSDAEIMGDDPERTGHYGWTVPDGITVSAESEPAGLYRKTSSQMYYYGGSYYYLTITSGNGTLWRADSLDDPEPERVQSNMSFFRHRFQKPGDQNYYSYSAYAVVWHGGTLYYTDSDKKLTCYSLTDGSAAKLGSIPFEAAASADGKYDSTRDAIGLYYDGETGDIVAVSRTRPKTELARIQVKEYPVSWDQMDQGVTALAGCVRKNDGVLRVGLVWAEARQSARLLVAFYQDGQLLETRVVTSGDWTQGLNVLEFDAEGYPDHDQVILFLLSDSSVPYCEKKTA